MESQRLRPRPGPRLALYVIIAVEEVELEERFGVDYMAYKASVNRMIPMPSAWRQLDNQQRV